MLNNYKLVQIDGKVFSKMPLRFNDNMRKLQAVDNARSIKIRVKLYK